MCETPLCVKRAGGGSPLRGLQIHGEVLELECEQEHIPKGSLRKLSNRRGEPGKDFNLELKSQGL